MFPAYVSQTSGDFPSEMWSRAYTSLAASPASFLATLCWQLVVLESESESESCSGVSDSLRLHGLYSPWNSPGKNTGVGSLSLLQGIFPTQGLNPGLPHCRQILYQLSHQGSSLEWVAVLFSRQSFKSRDQTQVFHTAGGLFTI